MSQSSGVRPTSATRSSDTARDLLVAPRSAGTETPVAKVLRWGDIMLARANDIMDRDFQL